MATRYPQLRPKALALHLSDTESIDRDFSFLSLMGSPEIEGRFDDPEDTPRQQQQQQHYKYHTPEPSSSSTRAPRYPQLPDSGDDGDAAFESAEEYFSAGEFRESPGAPRAGNKRLQHGKHHVNVDDDRPRRAATANRQRRPLVVEPNRKGHGKSPKKQSQAKGNGRENERVRVPSPHSPRPPRRVPAERMYRAESEPAETPRQRMGKNAHHARTEKPFRAQSVEEEPLPKELRQAGKGRHTSIHGGSRGTPISPGSSRESSFARSSSFESRTTASTAPSSVDLNDHTPSKPTRYEPEILYSYLEVPPEEDTEPDEEPFTPRLRVVAGDARESSKKKGIGKTTSTIKDKAEAKGTAVRNANYVPELPPEYLGSSRKEKLSETPRRKGISGKPPTPKDSDDEEELQRLLRMFEEDSPPAHQEKEQKGVLETFEDDEEALLDALRQGEKEALLDALRQHEEDIPELLLEWDSELERALNGPANQRGHEGYVDSDDDTFSITESLENGMAELTMGPPARPFRTFQYIFQWEVTRFSLALGISLEDLEAKVPGLAEPFAEDLHNATSFGQYWKVMKDYARHLIPAGKKMPTLGLLPLNVWQMFKDKGWSNGFELSGRATFIPDSDHLEIVLNPPSLGWRSTRFAARFGSDRFLTLRVPSGQGAQAKREQIVEGLVRKELKLINRTWRCFYVRDGGKKAKDNPKDKETYLLAYFFAESGIGLGTVSYRAREQLGFIEDEKLVRGEMTRDDLIRWHMPMEQQLDKDFSKIWSRISLSLSSSNPTVTFEPQQIRFVSEHFSPAGKVMNDGCSVCSPKVMRMVREKLDLAETPTAVQGRLGGAKGVWFVDPDADRYSEEIYIKINDSQLKYPFHKEDKDVEKYDWARMTLFVLNYSKEPVPTTLNLQLVPILSRQGVPFETFKELLETHLEEDLDELFQAATNRLTMRHWLSSHGLQGQSPSGEIPTIDSGTPLCQEQQMAMLLDAGFDPVECNFLMEKVIMIVRQYCDKILEKLHIRVPCSTVVYCVADPTGTLKEGEVSLQFSKGFMDPITQTRRGCIEGDVLVARNPAHLPTDIQKVRAVHPTHPGLRDLKDVIVFSQQGDIPLADMLSGGDYDGDKPWVCWDQRIVSTFQNSRSFKAFKSWDSHQHFEPSSPIKALRDLGDDPDDPAFFQRFFTHGFQSAILNESILGFCTSVLERYIYGRPHTRRGSIDGTIIHLANLCGVLVDAPKQGLRPTEQTVAHIRKLSRQFPTKPAYKSPNNSPRPAGPVEEWYLLDRLILDVGTRLVNARKAFILTLKAEKTWYPDAALSHLYNSVSQSSEQSLKRILAGLTRDLQAVHDAWIIAARDSSKEGELWKHRMASPYALYRNILPLNEGAMDADVRVRRWYQDGDREWLLLKASCLWTLYYKSTMPWWLAMRELCFMKAMGVGAGAVDGGDGGPAGLRAVRVVREDMFGLFKTVKPGVIYPMEREDGDDNDYEESQLDVTWV